MKQKFLLSAILFFYCFNSFSQEDLKSPQGNNGNSNSTAGGCQSFSYDINYNVFPPADSIIANSSWPDTVYSSALDSAVFDANWDPGDCGPISQAIWYKENIPITTVNYSIWVTHAYMTFFQPGDYHCLLIGYNGYPHKHTRHIVIINTNSTTSINNQTNPNLNVSIIKNKIIVKDLLEKDNLMLSVYDLTGRIIFNKEIMHPAATFEIELPELSNGLYVLNLGNKNVNFLKKFHTTF